MLDRDNETVVAVYPPDMPVDKMLMEADGRTLILMTVENSPGYLDGKYIDGKFHKPDWMIERESNE